MSVQLDNPNILFKPIPNMSHPNLIKIKPIEKRCIKCNNTGKIQTIQEESCRNCLGTGQEIPNDPWSDNCMVCNGFKKISYQGTINCIKCSMTAKL